MADELVALAFLLDEAFKRSHPVKDRLPSFMTLLDSRNKNLVNSFAFDDAPLAELAVEESQLVKANLRRFLGKPLYAIHQLCRCHSQMQMPTPSWPLRQRLLYMIEAAMPCSGCDCGSIE